MACIGPAGEKLVRFAAIQGDYGHVASKNGVGAVMGKKKLKAVAIVKGTKALTVNDPRGVVQAADEIAHDLKTDPSARSLYEYGTLPGVVNLSKLGALPIKNYTTNDPGNVTGANLSDWEAPKLREVPTGDQYAWSDASTYVKNPPYFEGMTMAKPRVRARRPMSAGGSRSWTCLAPCHAWSRCMVDPSPAMTPTEQLLPVER